MTDIEHQTFARTLVSFRPRDWKAVLKRAWERASEEELALIASGVAFNGFLALLPLLTVVVLTYGLFAKPEQVAEHITVMAEIMPQKAADLIAAQLQEIVELTGTSAGVGLLLALALAIFGAMRGAGGIVSGLNIAACVDESRPWLHRLGINVSVTIAMALGFVFASLIISILGFLEGLLPGRPELVGFGIEIATWLAAFAAINLVISAIYWFVPNRQYSRWNWLSVGSIAASIIWIVATLGFSFYVRNFGNYNVTYGSLGAVIIFLLWLYLSAYILLLGAILNQIIEERAKKAG